MGSSSLKMGLIVIHLFLDIMMDSGGSNDVFLSSAVIYLEDGFSEGFHLITSCYCIPILYIRINLVHSVL